MVGCARMRWGRLLVTGVAVLSQAAAAEEPSPPAAKSKGTAPAGVAVERDIEYGKGGDVSLRLDLYRPDPRPEGLLPAVVWIHGGGWRGGDKGQRTDSLERLARRGYAVAGVNYRLSGVAPFPAAIEDCKCAVRWMRARAADTGVDPDRIGAWGASAGGHLALLLGCADDKAGLEGAGGHEGVSSRIRAVCSWFGPTDFTKGHREFERGGGGSVLAFLGGTPGEKPDAYRLASPVTHISKDAPPILLMHGDRDATVPFSQSEVMHLKLKEAGVESTLFRVKNGGHGFQSVGGEKAEPAMPEILEATFGFFDKHLKGDAKRRQAE